MRYMTVFAVLCSMILAASSWCGAIPGPDFEPKNTIAIPGRFVVRFTQDARLAALSRGFGMFKVGEPSVDAVLNAYGTTGVRPLFPVHEGTADVRSRYYVITIPQTQDESGFVTSMLGNPKVAEVVHDVACRFHVSPNDPHFLNEDQWALYQTSRRDIHAPEGWDIETGSDSVKIAIIDSGIHYLHPDLKNNIWINPGEDLDGDMVVFDSTDFNNADDDGNGYRDDVIGYDFFEIGVADPWPGEDAGVKDNDPMDFNGHGTHCAGIAAAVTNNGQYGAGVAGGWGRFLSDRGVQIMCLRAGYSAVNPENGQEIGYAVMSAVVEAIEYAVDNGADVISYSAGASNIPGMGLAVTHAANAGIVFCHAAGNDGSLLPDYFGTHPELISVAATNSLDRRWSGSNYGDWVEVAAPGVDIYSTYSNHGTYYEAILTGTSMATPMAAGLAALIKSHYPAYDKTIIDTLLCNRADSINDPQYLAGQLGGGRINAYNCLQDAPVAKFSASPRSGPAPLAVTFTDESPAATTWLWDFGDGETSPEQNPVHIYIDPGLYHVSLEVSDPNGVHKKIRKYYVFATADTLYGDTIRTLDSSFAVPIRLKNTVPLENVILSLSFPATGEVTFKIDSLTTPGTLAEGIDTSTVAYSSASGKYAYRINPLATTANDPFFAGDSVLINIWVTARGYGTAIIDTVTINNYSLTTYSRFADYVPTVIPIVVKKYLYARGDVNGDGVVNVGDIVYLINYIFKDGWPPADDPMVYAGDANGDGIINVGDAVFMVNYVFKSGPPPPP